MNDPAKKTGYNPYSYWYDRAMDYRVSIDSGKEIEFLRKIIQEFDLSGTDMLEVGSGHGRIFKALNRARLMDNSNIRLIDPDKFKMVDIVDPMRFKCFQNTGMLPDLWDGLVLPYSDGAFDLVISFSVMLHVPPADIEAHFKECCRVTKNHLYIATCRSSEKPLADHCFIHEYSNLIDDNNMAIVDFKIYSYSAGSMQRINWLLKKI